MYSNEWRIYKLTLNYRIWKTNQKEKELNLLRKIRSIDNVPSNKLHSSLSNRDGRIKKTAFNSPLHSLVTQDIGVHLHNCTNLNHICNQVEHQMIAEPLLETQISAY